VPSGKATACKASAQSLAAQARKYGLGMMFATQTPKGIDNKIVSNCTTHVYDDGSVISRPVERRVHCSLTPLLEEPVSLAGNIK